MVSNEDERKHRAKLEAIVRSVCSDSKVGVGNYDFDLTAYRIVRQQAEGESDQLTTIPRDWIRFDETEKIHERLREVCPGQ